VAIKYAFDLYPRANPVSGTRDVRFSQLQDAEYKGEANGTGSGRIVIRGTSTDAAFIDPRGMQYIRVVRINTAVVDGGTTSGFSEKVVGGFFLEQGDFEALTERSTKKLSFGGAGTLSYLARGIVASTTYDPDATVDRFYEPHDGAWHWYYSTIGSILWVMVDELQQPARPQNPIPGLTMDFSFLYDSDSVLWPGYGDRLVVQAAVFTPILEVARMLMGLGLYVSIDPDTFVLSAWMADGHGRDRTGGAWGANVVRFQKPSAATVATGNIKSDAKRGIAALVKRSDLLVGSPTGVVPEGSTGYEWVNDPSGGIVWEGGYPVEDDTGDSLATIGAVQLAARSDAGDTVRLRMKLGNSPATGEYLPFEHVQLDDRVTLHTGSGEWDWNETTQKVAGITLKLRDGGDWDAWVDLGSKYASIEDRSFQVGTGGAVSTLQLCDLHRNLVAGLQDASLKASGVDTGNEKSKAVDGDESTRWSPPNATGPTPDHWWAADVGVSATAVAFRYLDDYAEDLASAGSLYGSNDSAAWSWLPSGKLVADPVANGWTLVAGWTGLASPDTGVRGFDAATYRYWLVRATAGGAGGSNEFDISEFELWSNARAGTSPRAARCDHGHSAAEIDYDNSDSGLAATDVQEAIDEVEGRIDTLEVAAVGADVYRQLAHGGFLYALHADDGADQHLFLLASLDGLTFDNIAGTPLFTPDTSTGNARDASIIHYDGSYWIAHTGATAGSDEKFTVMRSEDLVTWIEVTEVDMTSIASLDLVWAPEWFVDPATGDLHVFVACSTNSDTDFQIREVHPTNRGMTTWSTPVTLTGTFPANMIDPFMVYAPEIGTAGKPYKLWYKEEDGAFIEYLESDALTSGFSVVESGNWASFKVSDSIEGECIVKLDNERWRIYFVENDGLDPVAVYYSDSTDGWATWSARAAITTPLTHASQGTVIRLPSTYDHEHDINAHGGQLGGATALSDLSDVDLDTPAEGDALIYADGAWRNIVRHTEVLMSDGISNPPDPVLNEDGDDWLYGTVST